VGLVRRVRFGVSCEAAVEKLFDDLPQSQGPSLVVVDAGIATKEQFAEAPPARALLGRLRINCKRLSGNLFALPQRDQAASLR
jgi:hypothetical protein